MRHPLQQQPITKVQPSPPVVNHIPSVLQPCCINKILANDVPQGLTLGIGIPFHPRGSNSRCMHVTLARRPFQLETATENIERTTSQWMIDSGVIVMKSSGLTTYKPSAAGCHQQQSGLLNVVETLTRVPGHSRIRSGMSCNYTLVHLLGLLLSCSY
jgi:hypothetical protein